MDLKMKINGRKIKELMVINGWGIQDIANKTQLNRVTISRALHGEDLAPKTVSKLYESLDIDIDDLIDWGSDG